MHALINNIFLRHFKGGALKQLDDSAVLDGIAGDCNICFTTDSYTVSPLFFKGGDIGKLSVCGTINDISVTGATPLFLSCAVISEEGLDMAVLERIAASIAETAVMAGVEVATGDFKVVERGKADKVFINTSAIGIMGKHIKRGRERIKTGDRVIINGYLGDHELAVLLARKSFDIESDIRSDCAPLNSLIEEVLDKSGDIRFMRDPTRGGVATTLNEIVEQQDFGISLYEKDIPVREKTKALCEMLGFDPLYLANEGKVLVVCSKQSAEKIVSKMKGHKYGRNARIIGEIVGEPAGKVILNTAAGSRRIVDMLSGSQLPRIC